MFTRQRVGLICGMRCTACDNPLSEEEDIFYKEMDNLCNECYSLAMDSAYNVDHYGSDA